MIQGFQTMKAAEALLSGEAATPPAETWNSAQVFRFKTRESPVTSNGGQVGKLPIWQVMQQLSKEIGGGRNGKQGGQDEPLAERWKLQSEGLSSQVASLRAQLAEARRNQDCLRNDLYESMKREASLKAKLAATESKLDAVERWAQVLGQGMEDEVSRNFLESDKKQLQNLTECLALAVKSMSLFVGLMDKDKEGDLRYTFVHNQKQFFGDVDMIGKRDDEILPTSIPGVEEAMAVKQKTLETGATSTGEITLVLPDACTHWMLTCEPRRNQSSEVVGVAVAAVNITETVEGRARLAKLHSEIASRDATEAELRKAISLTEEAMRTKSMFLAIMSHEMRTPLNGVLGIAHVLQTTPLDEEQRELVDAMLASGDTLLAIVDDAVDVRKLEAGEVSQHCLPFNPHHIVNQVLHMASAAIRNKAITFEANIASNVPTEVLGDELRIRQVLTNLVHNSLKFTDSGFIRISISVPETFPAPPPPPPADGLKAVPLHSALSGADSSCMSGLTIAGGEGLQGNATSEALDEVSSSLSRLRSRASQAALCEESQGDEEQVLATPSSVLDTRLQDMDESGDRRFGGRETDGMPCWSCGASGGEGTRDEGRIDKPKEGSTTRDVPSAEREEDRGFKMCRFGGVGCQQGAMHRSLTRQRSLDKQVTWENTPERIGRGSERLQRQNSRSNSGGRQGSPRTVARDLLRRPGGCLPEQRSLQRENSLASISEGMLDFEEVMGRIEVEMDQFKHSPSLSRQGSLDSVPGSPGSLQQRHGLGRNPPLARKGSMSYVTGGVETDCADSPKLKGLKRSVSVRPEKVDGFGDLHARRTVSEHAFVRSNSFDENAAPPVWLKISVEDSGCGIPEEAFPMLFEKFTQVDASTTRQYGGTGLGLAICKQLVENILCGKMEVESKLDVGSTFSFAVPCQRPPPSPTTHQEDGGMSEEQGESSTIETVESRHLEDRSSNDMVWREETEPATQRPPSQGVPSSSKPTPLEVPHFDPPTGNEGTRSPHTRSPPHSPPDNRTLTSLDVRGFKSRPSSPPSDCSLTPPVSKPNSLGQKEMPRMVGEAPPLSPTPPTSPLPAPPPDSSPPSLLLVEDNNINVVVAQSMLKRLGLRADVAGNGVEAVQALRRKKYHLVMMDICMPRMDGLQTTSAVRRFQETGEWRFEEVAESDVKELESSPATPDCGCQTGIHVPIIAMTANTLEVDVSRCYSHGLDAFIAKPVSFGKLRSVLEHFLPWYKFELKGARK